MLLSCPFAQFGYRSLLIYLKQQGFDILTGYMARHKSSKINGFRGYLAALFNTVSTGAQKHVKVILNTGHITVLFCKQCIYIYFLEDISGVMTENLSDVMNATLLV